LKIILFIFVALIFVVTPVYAQLLSDATGLVNRLDVEIGGQTFEVETVSNFDVRNFEFDEDDKRLTIFISSSLENNLGDLIIPQSLLGGNMTFYLNDQEYFPKMYATERITFVTLNFTGSGDNKLDVVGTTYFFGLTEKNDAINNPSVSITTTQPVENSNDSLLWIAFTIPLVVITVLIVMKIKKKN
jgi:hypothetical protein